MKSSMKIFISKNIFVAFIGIIHRKVPVQEIRMSNRRSTNRICSNDTNFSYRFISVNNLQTAYIEFNTVEEAQQWMTLTQVQTKDLNSSIILVLYIYWWECSLFTPMDGSDS